MTEYNRTLTDEVDVGITRNNGKHHCLTFGAIFNNLISIYHMDNIFTGQVIAIMDERSGISKNGSTWREREYVIKGVVGCYPKTICIKVNGENIGKFNIQLGETVTAHLDINAHDWQGKWFNEVFAWRIDRA